MKKISTHSILLQKICFQQKHRCRTAQLHRIINFFCLFVRKETCERDGKKKFIFETNS